MPEPVIPPAPRSAGRKSHFNNWISAIGAVVALGALFSFALLVWMDFTQGEKNPYLGIFTYIVAPGFLIAGIALTFFGAWAQRRWAPGPGVSYAPKLRRWGHYCTHLREGQINSKARAERRNAALRVNC